MFILVCVMRDRLDFSSGMGLESFGLLSDIDASYISLGHNSYGVTFARININIYSKSP